jgi:hypothetical protein
MSWVIYLKFLSVRKFVLIEYLTLNYIFAYCLNAIWLLYQLIIHACSEAISGKIFFSKFSSSLRFSVWSIRMVLLLGPNTCGLVIWTVKWHVQMRAILPSVDLAVAVWIGKLRFRTDTLQVLKSHIFFLPAALLHFWLVFWRFVRFSRVLSHVFILFCHFVLFLSIPGIFLYLLHSF